MSPQDREQLLRDVEAFCEEIRPEEEFCYVERKSNEQVIPLAKKHNILGMLTPTPYQGRGADTVTYLKALARIGREGTGVRTFFSGHVSIGAYPIVVWGTEDQKQRYLPAACRGEKILAFGLTEPEAGSNPLEMQSTFRKEGNKFIVKGEKYLISNGGICDAVLIFAYPEGVESGPNRRVSAFILDTNQPGFHCESFTPQAKMGMPTSNTAMFEMKDVEIPLENMLGEEGNGFRVAMSTLVSGRLSVAAGCLGVIEDCLQEAITYSKERHQHGKPIAKHQLIQDHIAHIEMDRVASESLILRAGEAKDASTANPSDKELARQADILAAQAKFFATNAAWDAADRTVQVFGGRGWSTLYRPGRHLIDVRVCRIYEGTDEILKLKIAASVLGKEYEAFK
jgi:alkylation response protein AidB-like acyl-CoA dehydrogenase